MLSNAQLKLFSDLHTAVNRGRANHGQNLQPVENNAKDKSASPKNSGSPSATRQNSGPMPVFRR